MVTVAYITNEFPVAVEPYVVDEIHELRKRGVKVVPGSVRHPLDAVPEEFQKIASETLYLQPFHWVTVVRTIGFCLQHSRTLVDVLWTAIAQRDEALHRRVRAMAHTLLGAYYAVVLRPYQVEHIHVHHGYFASWIAMTAARLLGITYSMTLHGSDLLVHRTYLDLKLKHCKFCLTVSEFNRQYILTNYPDISPQKIQLQRMGVDALNVQTESADRGKPSPWFVILSVGRLHPVKDHAFLLRACKQLKNRGVRFICLIAGEGPERATLENLIRDLDLQHHVTLLGHQPRAKLEAYYSMCDLVVLTSRSEGVPLVLMEAMAYGRTVLAPAITGIPELVVDGRTGFLYRPGSVEDFVARVEAISGTQLALGAVRHRARRHVLEHFNRTTNLAAFAEIFPVLVAGAASSPSNENSLLQQI